MIKLIFLRAFLLLPDEEDVSRCLLTVYHWEQIRSVRNKHEHKGYETSIQPYVKPDDLQRLQILKYIEDLSFIKHRRHRCVWYVDTCSSSGTIRLQLGALGFFSYCLSEPQTSALER